MGLFAVKLGSSKRYCTGKRFSASFQRVRLIFISFCSKERFCLSSAKLRCFQHYRTGVSLSFYVNCAFDPLSYRKHVLVCLQQNWAALKFSSILLQKNSDFVFRFGIPFFESHSSENTCFACWQQNRTALSFSVFAFFRC